MKAISCIGKALGMTAKLALAVVVLLGTFVMNCIGVLLCAITD